MTDLVCDTDSDPTLLIYLGNVAALSQNRQLWKRIIDVAELNKSQSVMDDLNDIAALSRLSGTSASQPSGKNNHGASSSKVSTNNSTNASASRGDDEARRENSQNNDGNDNDNDDDHAH